MGKPLITIGIPTYRRPALLRQSLSTAVSQTYANIEIIVCDNEPSIEAEGIAAAAGREVRYVANETNLGAIPNFAKLVTLAKGEYFVWLQDDDALTEAFAERAVSAFEKFENAAVYAAYAVYSPSLQTVAAGSGIVGVLYGPPFPLNWISPTPERFPGSLAVPFGLLTSIAMPPTVAFRTEVLRTSLHVLEEPFFLLSERLVLALNAMTGDIVADPVIGGFFRQHSGQASFSVMSGSPDAFQAELKNLAGSLEGLVLQRKIDWEADFSRVLSTVPRATIDRWVAECSEISETCHFANDIRDVLRRFSSVTDTALQYRAQNRMGFGKSVAGTAASWLVPAPILRHAGRLARKLSRR